MTRTLGLAITLVLGAISTFSVSAAAQPAQGEPYKIGIILPMTGTTADYGADFNRGALLAEEEINAAGGIKGHPIKLVHGDSKNQPKDGVAEFKRLVEIEKVPAVISTMTGVILPQFPLSRETNTPMICVGAITPEIRKGGPTVFSNYPLADDEEREIAEYVVNKLGHKTAAIIYENSSYGKTLSQIFIAEFKKLGGTFVAEEVIEKGGRDFRSQLTRIGAQKPPVTVVYAYYAEGGLIVRQAAELGIKTQFISHGSIQNQSFADIAGPAAEGFISASPRWDENSPQVKAFIDRYKKKYGKDPDLYGPYFYDAVKMYAAAIEKGGYTNDGIRTALKGLKDFPGVNGTMNFGPDNVVLLPLRFVRFEKGQWVPIKN
ncbi:MAG: ABC transporter substrate-binding protein [Bacteroidota bacterium]|nr:ABC transporter substrate-binding protein [Hyphomicrobiaceae bacterium]